MCFENYNGISFVVEYETWGRTSVALAIVSKFNHKLRSKSSLCECKWKKLMVLLLLLYEETFKYRLSCFSINYALFLTLHGELALQMLFLLSHVTTIDSCFEQFYRWCSAGRKSQCTSKHATCLSSFILPFIPRNMDWARSWQIS